MLFLSTRLIVIALILNFCIINHVYAAPAITTFEIPRDMKGILYVEGALTFLAGDYKLYNIIDKQEMNIKKFVSTWWNTFKSLNSVGISVFSGLLLHKF